MLGHHTEISSSLSFSVLSFSILTPWPFLEALPYLPPLLFITSVINCPHHCKNSHHWLFTFSDANIQTTWNSASLIVKMYLEFVPDVVAHVVIPALRGWGSGMKCFRPAWVCPQPLSQKTAWIPKPGFSSLPSWSELPHSSPSLHWPHNMIDMGILCLRLLQKDFWSRSQAKLLHTSTFTQSEKQSLGPCLRL